MSDIKTKIKEVRNLSRDEYNGEASSNKRKYSIK